MSRRVDGVGVVRAISYPGKVINPSVRVTLDFENSVLLLIFQSRNNLYAIEIGQSIRVTGNCVVCGEQRLLYNPSYEILN